MTRKAKSPKKKATKPQTRRRASVPDVGNEPEQLEAPGTLTPAQYEFCLVYLSNGYNATAAYRATHPNCKSDGAARVEGHRTLANPNVRAFVLGQLEDVWRPYEMGAEEAGARVAMDARADLRLLFDDKNNLRPVHEWPDEIANSVESVDFEKGKIKLVSKLGARRLVLELTGKLRGEGDGLRDLAEILAEKWRDDDGNRRSGHQGDRRTRRAARTGDQ